MNAQVQHLSCRRLVDVLLWCENTISLNPVLWTSVYISGQGVTVQPYNKESESQRWNIFENRIQHGVTNSQLVIGVPEGCVKMGSKVIAMDDNGRMHQHWAVDYV